MKTCKLCENEIIGPYNKIVCDTCIKLYGKGRPASRLPRALRVEYLNRIKLASGCVQCGYNASPIALDFDHINHENKSEDLKRCGSRRSIGDLPWDKIDDEIAKCQVLCANCHRVKSWEEEAFSNDH